MSTIPLTIIIIFVIQNICKGLMNVFLRHSGPPQGQAAQQSRTLYQNFIGMHQGRIQGGPPDHQKWGPSTKILQNWGPRMEVLGPKIIIFFKNLSLTLLGINSWLLIISIFSRLATLVIVLCIYVSMHHFILFSLAHISCTLWNVHLSWTLHYDFYAL